MFEIKMNTDKQFVYRKFHWGGGGGGGGGVGEGEFGEGRGRAVLTTCDTCFSRGVCTRIS